MEMKASSFSYVIAIDSSESMGARDLNPDRLTAAKESAKEFIDSLPIGTKVGVTSFASNTFIEKKLTDNKNSLKFSIDNIKLTNIGGTDIFEVYRTSSTILDKEPNKALIILSDGQINIGNIDEVVTEALRDEVVIHTIGIGTVSGGNTSFGISKLDEDSLKSLAYSTKGRYFNVVNEDNLKDSFKEIIPLTNRIAAIDMSFYMIILTIILFIIQQFYNQISKVTI
jgi:Ca-activated chloride channel family protein